MIQLTGNWRLLEEISSLPFYFKLDYCHEQRISTSFITNYTFTLFNQFVIICIIPNIVDFIKICLIS